MSINSGPGQEDVLFEAVFRWFDHEPKKRAEELRRLLRVIDLASVSRTCRKRVLEMSKLDVICPGELQTF